MKKNLHDFEHPIKKGLLLAFLTSFFATNSPIKELEMAYLFMFEPEF